MKVGVRKPNIKKSIKARTTGKIKRSVKKATNPFYGKKGTGYINNPEKAIYNKVYNKTTVGIDDFIPNSTSHSKTIESPKYPGIIYKMAGIIGIIFSILAILIGVISSFGGFLFIGILFIGGGLFLFIVSKSSLNIAKQIKENKKEVEEL